MRDMKTGTAESERVPASQLSARSPVISPVFRPSLSCSLPVVFARNRTPLATAARSRMAFRPSPGSGAIPFAHQALEKKFQKRANELMETGIVKHDQWLAEAPLRVEGRNSVLESARNRVVRRPSGDGRTSLIVKEERS